MVGKIFCVGLPKTGTTSLQVALERLGYRVCGCYGAQNPEISRTALELGSRFLEQYDAFRDNPWCWLYKELDQQYPGSKFILTVRDPQDWIRSQVAHFAGRGSFIREWGFGYGSPLGHEHEYLTVFERHNREVQEYFAGRDNLLVFDVRQGWDPLCQFLGHGIPSQTFPWANKGNRKSPK